jgi:outer membrane lipoprotein-sorting protein
MKYLIFALVVFFYGNVWAQTDVEAGKILDEMSSRYKKIPSYRAKFSYELLNNANGKVEKLDGNITVKGDKYYLKLKSQEVFNNQKTVWTYLPEEKEVIVSEPDEDDAMNPSKIYQIYRNGFRYALTQDQKVEGVLCYVILLEPEKTSKKKYNFVQCRLFIAKDSKHLKRWEMTEKGNLSKTSVTISEFVVDNRVKDSEFYFDKSKYPGVRVEEMR